MLSQELLVELQTIIKEDYSRELDLEQVSLIGRDLVGYFDLLAKIHHESIENKNDNEITPIKVCAKT